jgi:uncharacterized protein YjbI with pentapeptide repeats
MRQITRRTPGAATQNGFVLRDLGAILEAHRLWVHSQTAEGRRADLSHADLRGADLSQADLRGADCREADLRGLCLERAVLRGADLCGANLRRANLTGADLQEADLTGATLQGADLRRADLRGARLSRCVLRDADFQEADLTDAQGLLGGQLAGSNLSGARLPESLSTADGLANVAETSRSTQTTFTSIIVVCAYIWLTVASTTDVQLLNSAAATTSRLPILGTEIPLVRFYMAAPLLLLCLYTYFLLSLHRLWEELSELPAVFPDGRPLDKKAHPWLLNALVCQQFERLRGRCSRLSRWQARLSVLLAWGVVPVTLLLLWARYLRAHDAPVTALHVVLLAVAVGVGVGFHGLAIATLRGADRRRFAWKTAWKFAQIRSGLAVTIIGLMLGTVSIGAIQGINPAASARGVRVLLDPAPTRFDVRVWVPHMFAAIGYSPFANLDDASISIKPPNWSPQRPGDLGAVKGADLESRNLRFAQAYGAFFVNAYLRWANVEGTDLRQADLRQADLREANLRGANLRGTNLANCDLRWAVLDQANLREAQLQGARLGNAVLTNANLNRAGLEGADLGAANLRNASLQEARLGPLRAARSGSSLADLIRANESRPTSLHEADLRGADLSRADMRDIDLRAANLEGSVLRQADLRGANLSDATGLTADQLESVVMDERTKLPVLRQAPARGPN